MDSINMLFNIVLPLISLFSLFFFLPSILLFKIFRFISRSVFSINVAGKVVLITSASSGIGEHLAYEYAKGGACLVLVARREKKLEEVAKKAQRLGSPDVIVECGDVSKSEDCKRFVDAALNHFGRLFDDLNATVDHLVNDAGISPICTFEDTNNVDDFVPNINFWGTVYCTHFAIPHLRKSRGKIVAIATAGVFSPSPRFSIYKASKGAIVSFFETLKTEVGSDIGITIVAPGVVDSEITSAEFLAKDTNFWGSVYTTRFAVPHLRNTGSKIIAISSTGPWSPLPRMSVYNASKATMLAFFETLRLELGSDIHITIVTPGFIESEMTQGKCQARDGKLTLDKNIADAQVGIFPVARVDSCARAIVNGAYPGERYGTEPKWFTFTYWVKVFIPEAIEWTTRMLYMTSPGEPAHKVPTKKILDMTSSHRILDPETFQTPEIKTIEFD